MATKLRQLWLPKIMDVFQEVESGAKVISKELLMTEKKKRHWNQTLRLP